MGRSPVRFLCRATNRFKVKKGVRTFRAAGCSESEPTPGGGWLGNRGCPAVCPYKVLPTTCRLTQGQQVVPSLRSFPQSSFAFGNLATSSRNDKIQTSLNT
jgi:hypothetical protein